MEEQHLRNILSPLIFHNIWKNRGIIQMEEQCLRNILSPLMFPKNIAKSIQEC